MIYKVFYQEDAGESPIRELTQSAFYEAESVSALREHLTNTQPYMIEYIEEVSDALLEYEKEKNPELEIETI